MTIIIPVYNSRNYITRCVTSILDTNSNDFEVILVDDGSTDGSTEECSYLEKKDRRVRVIKKPNEGVASARNEGILAALGKYILFSDADDYYPAGALDFILEVLYQTTDIECIFFDYEREEKDKKIPVIMESIQDFCIKPISDIAREYWDLYNKGFINPVWNKVYSLDIMKKNNIKFNTELTMGEDGLFNLQYFLCCQDIVWLNQICYTYVRHESQATLHKHDDFFEMMDTVFNEIEIFITRYTDLSEEYYQNWLKVIFNTFYHQNFKLNNKEKILNNYHTKKMCRDLTPRTFVEKIAIKLINMNQIGILNILYCFRACLIKIKNVRG